MPIDAFRQGDEFIVQFDVPGVDASSIDLTVEMAAEANFRVDRAGFDAALADRRWEDAETRAWSRKFFEKMKRMPSSLQAADYSAVTHYLKAVEAAKTDDADKVLAQMKATPINDFFSKGQIRKEDGRFVHDMYLFEAKTPAESKGPWDYYKLVATVPGDKAFLPLSQSKCPMVKK